MPVRKYVNQIICLINDICNRPFKIGNASVYLENYMPDGKIKKTDLKDFFIVNTFKTVV